jgi:hypothetical protein
VSGLTDYLGDVDMGDVVEVMSQTHSHLDTLHTTYSTGQKKGNTTIANDAKYTTVCAYIARKIFSSSILSRNRVHEVTNVGLTYAYMFAIANSEMREGRMRAN